VWNLFRHVPGCRAYYEPLNERRWFDPSVRGTRVDASHVGVADYWREYDGLTALGELYDIEWTRRRLYMRPGDTDAKLFAYIAALVHQSPERAVLQFNRVDFRLPWLVRHFPTARFVHIFREPRDQWCSTLQGDAFPRTGTVAEFESRDQFYLLSWARDLAAFFPFMDPRDAAHPYEVFYYIWRLSHAFGQRYCHVSFGYEALCQSPEVEIPRLMDAAGIPSGEYDMSLLQSLVHPRGVGRWQSYADDSWFRRHEIRCEVELEKFFASSDAAHDERSEETAALPQRRARRELAVRSA
jgi:hypothetical protein